MECQRCGACCKVFGIVEIHSKDEVPPELVELCELGYHRMKTIGFVCIAYEENKHEHCTIYASRPEVCRLLKPGGKLCLMARLQMAAMKPVQPWEMK